MTYLATYLALLALALAINYGASVVSNPEEA